MRRCRAESDRWTRGTVRWLFVAFEGYDTVVVLADVLRSHRTDGTRATDPDRTHHAESWPRVGVEGTRGQIRFSRTPGISVWQWVWPPVQVVDRDPAEPGRFRILHAGGESTEIPRRAAPQDSGSTGE